MVAKKIHHKLREKTKNMSLSEKVKYLSAHKEKKEKAYQKSRDKKIADFRAQPSYDSKGRLVK